jgi:cell volume regulation protein A
MEILTDYIILSVAILLLLAVISSKVSDKLGIPTLLIFLFIGMLAGSEGIGRINFDNPRLAQSLGVLSLIFILFAGGFETKWEDIKPVLFKGVVLSTLGVLITCLLVGCFVALILNFSLTESMLLGAVVSSTDAAAVFAVLRSKKVGLKGQLKSLLEFESGSNDPMAVFLTVGIIMLLKNSDSSIASLVPMFIQQMIFGAILGYFMGTVTIFLVNHVNLWYDGLYPVLTISLVLLTYAITELLGGNGYLAVYISGIVMNKNSFIYKRTLMRFHDGLSWLMQITMFLTLGLLVFPSQLLSISLAGFLISAILMFLARPISVFVTMAFTRMKFNEKIIVSWVGLRGAVPIVLATFPLLAGISNAEIIFNIVFFIVLTSAILQGTTIPMVAKWLKVDIPITLKSRYPVEFEPIYGLEYEMIDIEVHEKSNVVDKRIRDIPFPKGTLVLLIRRGEKYIVPNGETKIEDGDIMLVLVNKKELPKVYSIA